MASDEVIDAVVREYAHFYLEDVEDEPVDEYVDYCAYAQIFHRWCGELLSQFVDSGPTPVRLAQAKVLLQDRYFGLRASVPKSHRNRMGGHGHICIFQVYEQAYQKIRLVELTLTPPQVVVPTPPPPQAAPKPALLGITLGEVLGEA
jgi:hypothetical protein